MNKEKEKEIILDYNEEIVEKILCDAYSEEYGVRSIKHYIEKEVGTLIARSVVSGFLQVGVRYLLDIEKGTQQIKLTTISLLEQKKFIKRI